jgi:biopolymer transport protein ExbB
MPEFAAPLIARAALWVLLAFSIATWSLIVVKACQSLRLARADRRFATAFWHATDLDAAAKLPEIAAPNDQQSPKARVANALFADALALSGNPVHDLGHSWNRKDLAERVLAQRIRNERRAVESGLGALASIGSTAPFVGLFGTVFGIIHALDAISHRASASIDVIAGPIGEALIATGVGIAVAVPAVLAYNFYIRRAKSFNADLDEFANDLLTLAQKQDFRLRGAAAQTSAPVKLVQEAHA